MENKGMPCEILSVVNSIAERFHPSKIYMFSNKRGAAGRPAGFKLCVVLDSEDMGETEREIYLTVESEVPFDLVLYKPKQFDELLERKGSFAKKIAETGVLLYG